MAGPARCSAALALSLLTLQQPTLAVRLESSGKSQINRGACEYGWTSGPIIIAGLSDGGGRGAKSIVNGYFGVKMSSYVTAQGWDDLRINNMVAKFWHKLVAQSGGVMTAEAYARSESFPEAAKVLCQAVKDDWDSAGRPSGVWGFESPRAITMIPVWEHLFGDDWKLVHTMRDPRASCRYYNNKVQYNEVCPYMLHPPENCQYPNGCYRYWADVNFMTREFFLLGGKMDRYIPLPMERIAVDEEPSEETEAFKFLQAQLPKLFKDLKTEDIINVLKLQRSYAKKYQAGHMLGWELAALNKNFKSLVEKEPLIGHATRLLGYKIDEFGPMTSWNATEEHDDDPIGRELNATQSSSKDEVSTSSDK